MACLSCLPQNLLSPLLNTLSQMWVSTHTETIEKNCCKWSKTHYSKVWKPKFKLQYTFILTHKYIYYLSDILFSIFLIGRNIFWRRFLYFQTQRFCFNSFVLIPFTRLGHSLKMRLSIQEWTLWKTAFKKFT